MIEVAPSLMPLVLIAALTLAAGALLWWGLRWRREATPPTCRRCGYDVSQRPAGVERCSECGADLTRRRAIRTTRRRRNAWVAGPAGVVAVVLAGLLAVSAATFPWKRWILWGAPVSWVAALARHDPTPAGEQYRIAWFARAGMSPAVVEYLLDLQADSRITWNGLWGDRLIVAFRDKQLSESQRARFVRQMFPPGTFRVRTPVRQGDPLVLSAAWPPRGGMHDSLSVRTYFAARVDGQAVIDPQRDWSMGVYNPGRTGALAPRSWGGNDVMPGKHKLGVAVAGEVVDRSNSSDPLPPADSERIEHHAELEIEVLPRDAPFGEPVEDPTKAAEVARQVSVKVSHWHDGRAFAEVELLPAGIDRAFAIYALIDGKERHIGEVAARAGAGSTSNAIYVPLSVERATKTDRLTIVLVADGDALKGSLQQTKYWVGRIVYPDVALGTFKDHYASDLPKPTTWPYRLEEPATRPSSPRP